MWTWSLNWGDITPHIVIGSCPISTDDLKRIHAEAKVSAVFSLQHNDCLNYWGIDYRAMSRNAKKLGLTMARCPIRDFDIPDMRRQLPDAISKLAELLAAGHRTYVHCTAGLGRAPLTVLGYLTLIGDFVPEDAIRLILKGRPEAVPAWEAFHGACHDLVTRYRNLIEQRAYELYELGIHSDALADWDRAQAEVLRSVLTAG